MSILGPVTTLQPWRNPNMYEWDFSRGDLPEGLVHTRASKATRLTHDGRIEEVDVDQPAITWVPESGAYGLQVEPAAVNKLTTGAGRTTGLIRPNGATIITGIDDPMGGNSAIRVEGTPTGLMTSPSAAWGSKSACATVILRPAAGTDRLRVFFRNNTKAINFPQLAVNTNTGEVEVDGPSVEGAAHRLTNGWWMLSVWAAESSNIDIGDLLVLYAMYGSLVSFLPFDIWKASFTEEPYASSFIIPGETATARAAVSAHIPVTDYWDLVNGGTLFADFTCYRLPGSTPVNLNLSPAIPFNNATRLATMTVVDETVGHLGRVQYRNGGGTVSSYLDTTPSTRQKQSISMVPNTGHSAINGQVSPEQTRPADLTEWPANYIALTSYLPQNMLSYIHLIRLYKGVGLSSDQLANMTAL